MCAVNVQGEDVSEVIEPVKTVTQLSAVPTTTAYVTSGAVPVSEADSCRIYGSSYSGVSFGSGFSPDNLLLTDRRPVRSRSHSTALLRTTSCVFFQLTTSCHDLSRKFFFTNRVVNIWNSLPEYVVHADTINCFKSRLDKFWSHQDLIYNFRAEICGTGSRSKVVY